jgi:hypothetical protein
MAESLITGRNFLEQNLGVCGRGHSVVWRSQRGNVNKVKRGGWIGWYHACGVNIYDICRTPAEKSLRSNA